jgi:hypothetical protein
LLTWKRKPLFFEPTAKFPQDFLGSVIGQFWLPEESGVDLRRVVAGVSNVYATSAVDHAIVNVSIAFDEPATAEQAASYLALTLGSRPDVWLRRSNTLLSFAKSDLTLDPMCIEGLRLAIEAEVEWLAE